MSRSTERTTSRTWVDWMILVAVATAMFGCAHGGDKRPAPRETRTEDGFMISETARVGIGVRSDFDRAVRAFDEENYDEAIELLIEVVEADPLLASAQIDLGMAYVRVGKLDAAEKSLQAALAANPQHPVAHNELAMVYRRLGRFEDARSSYEAALKSHPNFHYANRNLGILCDLYLMDSECAVKHYERFVAAVPNDEEAKIWLTDLRNRVGQ